MNYRYVEGELNYLFDNADVVALLHERPYAPLVAACAPKHAKLKTFVVLPDVTDPDNAADIVVVRRGHSTPTRWRARAPSATSASAAPTTSTSSTPAAPPGFPKGVMWRHEDFWRVLGGGIDFYTGEPLEEYDQSEAGQARTADGDVPAEPADARRRPGRAAHAPVRAAT